MARPPSAVARASAARPAAGAAGTFRTCSQAARDLRRGRARGRLDTAATARCAQAGVRKPVRPITEVRRCPPRHAQQAHPSHRSWSSAARVATSAMAPALHGFDLTVPSGTTLGVIGPSGAGKTTTDPAHHRRPRPHGRRGPRPRRGPAPVPPPDPRADRLHAAALRAVPGPDGRARTSTSSPACSACSGGAGAAGSARC